MTLEELYNAIDWPEKLEKHDQNTLVTFMTGYMYGTCWVEQQDGSYTLEKATDEQQVQRKQAAMRFLGPEACGQIEHIMGKNGLNAKKNT
jgi:hypothetical protein